MAAILLSLVLAVILGGVAWLMLGAKLRLDAETDANDVLNVFAYVAIGFPIVLIVTFLWAP